MKKLLGIFLASLAMFGFGAAFWMTPLTTSFFMASLDDETAGRRLKEMFPASGTYYVPSQRNPPAELTRLHEAGPVATIHIRHEGSPVMDAKVLAAGFVHELISMTLAALVMGALLSVLNTYVRRCVFMAMLGLLIAWFGPISQPIWWHQPWPVHVVNAVYTLLAWLVAGLVLAAFIKPARSAAK
jgi:hypothetical protein